MTTNDLVKVNKEYFIVSSKLAASAAIFTAFPYLKVPPFNYLIEQAINWMVVKIADGLELSAFFKYVDFRVDAQGKEYVIAAYNANILQTEESRKIADEKFKIFAHFNRY